MRGRMLTLGFIACLACAPSAEPANRPVTPAPAPASVPTSAAAPPTEPAPVPFAAFEIDVDDDLTPVKTLTRAQVREDMEVLQIALRSAWGGYEFVDRAAVTHAEATLAGLPETLNELSSAGVCAAVASALEALPDAHFAASLEGHPECRERKLRQPQVGTNVGAGGDKPWSWEVRSVGGRKIGVLALTRFRSPNDPVWDGMLDAIDGEPFDAAIVDMRGNPGGADAAAYWVAQALSGQLVRRKGVTIVRSQTPVALTSEKTRRAPSTLGRRGG